jgi:putative addiction module component (TIGR02574 family)
MTKAALALAALELSIEDQLDLAQTLWDHNSPPQDEPISPALAEILEARRSDALAHPEAAIEWADVKRRLLAKG